MTWTIKALKKKVVSILLITRPMINFKNPAVVFNDRETLQGDDQMNKQLPLAKNEIKNTCHTTSQCDLEA